MSALSRLAAICATGGPRAAAIGTLSHVDPKGEALSALAQAFVEGYANRAGGSVTFDPARGWSVAGGPFCESIEEAATESRLAQAIAKDGP